MIGDIKRVVTKKSELLGIPKWVIRVSIFWYIRIGENSLQGSNDLFLNEITSELVKPSTESFLEKSSQ